MPILGTIASAFSVIASWSTSRPVPNATGAWIGLTGSPSVIVAGKDDVYLSSSPDGVTWTQRNPPTAARFWTGSWSPTLNLFVFFTFNSTNCVTSPDGITWTLRVQPHSFYRTSIFAGGKFVAIGANQVPMCVSTDGVTFSPGSMPAAVYWLDVAYNGTVYCAISNNNTPNVAATSTDGTTWTARATPYNNMSGIAWNGSVFCAITGDTGTQSMTSPDGITWTTRTLPYSYNWCAITYWNNSLFVAINQTNSTVITSPDGITWTTQNPMPGFGANTPRLKWTGTYLVAMDYTNGNTYVSTTPIT